MKRLRQVAHRWVIKLGTGILTTSSGQIDVPQIEQLAGQLCALRRRKHEVLVVSSGAVGCGMSLLGLKKRPTAMAELQACAALGQPRLMRLYDEAFGRHGVRVAQVLVTYLDMDQPRHPRKHPTHGHNASPTQERGAYFQRERRGLV